MRARAWRSRAARPEPDRGSRPRRWPPGELVELTVEQRRAVLVERGVRLVEDEQRRVVEERTAEREPLRHPARERRDALGARVPEAEPFEQHPDPLAPLGHPVEPAVQLEVLERREVAVEQRLVPEVAEPAASRSTSRSPAVGAARPATRRSSVVLPEPFAPGDDEKAAAVEREVDGRGARASPVPLLEPPCARITSGPSSSDEARGRRC